MKILNKYLIIFFLSTLILSCSGQNKETAEKTTSKQLTELKSIEKIPLPEKGFYCGLLDKKGNLWFGSRGNGIFKFDGKTFTNFTKKDGLSDNDISCITEDKKGNLWFGTTNGACKFDGEKFNTIRIPQSDTSSVWLDKVYPVVNPNQVMSILEDTKGNLWFGTNGAGVYKYNEKSFTQHLSNIGKVYDDNLYHNIVLSIANDLQGNIWFTSLSHGGVSVYDGKEFTQYTSELSDDFVRVVFCDSKGTIWIGTHGNVNGGLDKFDGEKFKTFYKTNDGFRHNNIRWIFEDNDGLLWMGSGTTELTTFNGEHFEVFKDNQGKTYNKIIFVIGDKQDNIWFGNKEGLWKYNGKEVIEMTS